MGALSLKKGLMVSTCRNKINKNYVSGFVLMCLENCLNYHKVKFSIFIDSHFTNMYKRDTNGTSFGDDGERAGVLTQGVNEYMFKSGQNINLYIPRHSFLALQRFLPCLVNKIMRLILCESQ